MSWSVSAVGRSSAVKARLVKEIEDCCRHLIEPERTVAQAASVLLCAALDAQIPDTAVKATAFGSQSSHGSKGQPDRFTNSLKIEVEPISGFIE